MIRFLKLAVIALISGLLTACNLEISLVTAEAPASPTAIVVETPSALPLPPAATIPAPTPTSEFAPFCSADTAAALPQCAFPTAKESSVFCSDKIPYNLILIPDGLTYAVSEGFRCSDAGKKNEMRMITCTGRMAAEFQLSVCDPACVPPTVEAVNTTCPQGYNYDIYQGCCTQQIQVLNRNCMTYEFTTTTCVVNCGEYKKKSKCNQYSYACFWDDKEKLCLLRK